MSDAPITSVLVGTDYSAGSLLALPWAQAFAEALDARLTVAHVARSGATDDEAAQRDFRAAMDLLGVEPRVRSVLGEPDEALRRAAAAEDAHLLVTAHQPEHDGVFGRSLTVHLVRKATIPVLAVHVPGDGEAIVVAPRGIGEIVVGVAPGPSIEPAVARLARFCARAGVRLVLAAVLVDASRRIDPDAGAFDLDPGFELADRQAEADAMLTRLAASLPHHDVATVVVAADSVAAGLIALSIERGSDVIATVARGRGRIAAALLGSTTDDLLRISPLPTLVYGPRCFED